MMLVISDSASQMDETAFSNLTLRLGKEGRHSLGLTVNLDVASFNFSAYSLD